MGKDWQGPYQHSIVPPPRMYGMAVIVMPDDDAEARTNGWSEWLIKNVTPNSAAHNNADLFVRRATFLAMKAHFEKDKP